MSSPKEAWQDQLSNMITDPAELLSLLELGVDLLPEARKAAATFPLKVTHSFASRMRKGKKDDPLLRQVLPLGIELQTTAGYSKDPLSEAAANKTPGLLHKYKSRVLITLTSACAIHCRYCFRRHFPYEDNVKGRANWDELFRYIETDTQLNEVILSGGDPLAVSDSLLMQFSDRLASISHIKYLRLHTRLPIVLPARITPIFIEWISQLKQKPVIALHTNHPQEINDEVKHATRLLQNAGVPLFNQAVLLKGVNDDVQTLIDLSDALFEAGITPYYLHLLDKVDGSAHFDIPLSQAKALHQQLRDELPGYLVPALAREEPGASSKIIL